MGKYFKSIRWNMRKTKQGSNMFRFGIWHTKISFDDNACQYRTIGYGTPYHADNGCHALILNEITTLGENID